MKPGVGEGGAGSGPSGGAGPGPKPPYPPSKNSADLVHLLSAQLLSWRGVGRLWPQGPLSREIKRPKTTSDPGAAATPLLLRVI